MQESNRTLLILTEHQGEILELTVLSYQMSEAKSRKMSKEIEEGTGSVG